MKDLSNILAKFIFAQLTAELIRQGHKMTGSLIKSFETKIQEKTDSVSIEFLMLNYGLSLNYGITPARIPYTPGGPARGGKSKYIEGLIRFARIKLKADKKSAKGIAFAIARKQKEKGYPLTGKVKFIDNVLAADSDAIEELIQNHFEATIEMLISEFITFKNEN